MQPAKGSIWNTAMDTSASTGLASRTTSRLQAAWSEDPRSAPATFPKLSVLKPTAAPFTMGGSNAASVVPFQLDDPSSLTAWLVENDLSDFWGCFRREGYNTVRHRSHSHAFGLRCGFASTHYIIIVDVWHAGVLHSCETCWSAAWKRITWFTLAWTKYGCSNAFGKP